MTRTAAFAVDRLSSSRASGPYHGTASRGQDGPADAFSLTARRSLIRSGTGVSRPRPSCACLNYSTFFAGNLPPRDDERRVAEQKGRHQRNVQAIPVRTNGQAMVVAHTVARLAALKPPAAADVFFGAAILAAQDPPTSDVAKQNRESDPEAEGDDEAKQERMNEDGAHAAIHPVCYSFSSTIVAPVPPSWGGAG